MILNIITPNYNTSQFLVQTADSIKTIKNKRSDIKINWYIIDNLSTDNVENILTKYVESEMVTELIREKDSGLFYAMNKGLDNCSDGHVIFLGAGDKILELPKFIDPETVYYGTTIVDDSRHFVSTLDNIFVDTFCNLHHQSMLVPVQFHKHFNTEYKIAADYAHHLELLLENRNFELSPDLLGYHMPGGVSGNLEKTFLEVKVIQRRAQDLIMKGVLVDRI